MVTWYRGDKALKDGDEYEINKDATGVCRLTIKKATLKHTGEYSCKIDKQNDTTKTHLTVVGKNRQIIKTTAFAYPTIFQFTCHNPLLQSIHSNSSNAS